MTVSPWILAAVGGAAGASLRHGLSQWTLKTFGPGWPWGTFLANALGGFAMGLLVAGLAAGLAGGLAREARILLGVGLLGGFTTFSSYGLEVVLLAERKAYAQAAAYAGLSVIAAVGAVVFGLFAGRKLFA
ncbi:MAG: CrcB family protein [Maricaulaceae bacterium]